MGIELMPGFEQTYAVIRDRRGIQVVDLQRNTAHQLVLGEVEVEYTNLDFLKILFDPKKKSYGFATIYYGDLTDEMKDQLDEASKETVADGKTQKPLLCIYQFTHEFFAGIKALDENCTAERVLY